MSSVACWTDGYGQVDQRRIGHRRGEKDVHRRLARQPRGADRIGDAQATVDLHRAAVAALHLGQLDGGCVALDERAADAALAQVEGEGEADRARADDEDLGNG